MRMRPFGYRGHGARSPDRSGAVRIRGALVAAAVAALAVACGGGASKNTTKTKEEAIKSLDTTGKIRVAQSYFQSGRPAEAFDIMEKAIDEDPDNAGARNFYGQLLLLADRLDEAEMALRAALEIDPYLTDAHNNLGAVYDRLGRKTDAERQFLEVLDDPTYPTPEKAYFNLGLLYDSQGRLEDGLAMLRKAVEVNPKYYQAHYELAGMLERAGELTEAAKLYEVAAPGYRNFAPYHYRLGFTYFRLGDPVKAREHLNRVEEIAPGSESAAHAAKLLEMID